MTNLEIPIMVLILVAGIIFICYLLTLFTMGWGVLLNCMNRRVDDKVREEVDKYYLEDKDLYDEMMSRRKSRIEGLDNKIECKTQELNSVKTAVENIVNRNQRKNIIPL